MKTRTLLTIPIVGLLVLAGVFFNAPPALAECELPPGVTPLADPSVTAQQVENGSGSLMDFALAARERFGIETQTVATLEQVLYSACRLRQEGSPWRSGSTYLVSLLPDGRVLIHAKSMALSGRLLNPLIYAEILAALGVSLTDLANLASPDPAIAAQAGVAVFNTLSQEPDGAFDATSPIPDLRPGIPGASGYPGAYLSVILGSPIVLLAGFDLNETHLIEEEIDTTRPLHPNPSGGPGSRVSGGWRKARTALRTGLETRFRVLYILDLQHHRKTARFRTDSNCGLWCRPSVRCDRRVKFFRSSKRQKITRKAASWSITSTIRLMTQTVSPQGWQTRVRK